MFAFLLRLLVAAIISVFIAKALDLLFDAVMDCGEKKAEIRGLRVIYENEEDTK